MRFRPFAAIAVALGATVALAASDAFRGLARHSRPTHAAFESAATVIAVLAAYLVAGRFVREPSAVHLALACGLAMLAATNFVFQTLPAMQASAREGGPMLWVAVAGSLSGQVLVAYSSHASDQPLRAPRRAAMTLVIALVGGLAAVSGALALLGDRVPAVVRSMSTTQLSIDVHPIVTAAEALGSALFAVAALGFARRARRTGDRFLQALAVGAAIASGARASYVVAPTLYTAHVYVGDVLRMGFYIVLLVAAFLEIRAQWAVAAIAEERGRLARDLHDGLAQELAFITSQSRRLLDSNRSPTTVRLASAAERALGESRRAIASLSRPYEEPLAATVGGAAVEAAHRVGTTVRMEATLDDIPVAGVVREALVRVVREAVINAGRHGHASVVDLTLSNGGGVHMVVTDNGCGFDPSLVPADGSCFGLISMRERIEGLGGHVEIASTPGVGTRIEAHVP